jgi:hypothetical protein
MLERLRSRVLGLVVGRSVLPFSWPSRAASSADTGTTPKGESEGYGNGTSGALDCSGAGVRREEEGLSLTPAVA